MLGVALGILRSEEKMKCVCSSLATGLEKPPESGGKITGIIQTQRCPGGSVWAEVDNP